MPEAPASLVVPALLRRVLAAGGFAVVLHRGHAQGSAMLIVHRAAGGLTTVWERLPNLSGSPEWRQAAEGEEAVESFIARQRRFDPDLWVIELDIREPARFVEGFPTNC
jgi:hypothetical protein